VNSDILATASDSATSYLFWFLNNGITIICDQVHLNTDPDDAHVKIKNLQIVNGCQTASALAHAADAKLLKADTRVLIKIFETTDKTLASKVVLTTNNQNKINTRDLKANDAIQQDMQVAFKKYKLLYEHKVNQYAGHTPAGGEQFVSNEMVGQAYLALILRDPSDARRRKYKIWSDFYARIFNGKAIEAHVFSTLVCLRAQIWIAHAKKIFTKDELRRKVVANGMFHIARVAASLYMKKDVHLTCTIELNKSIAALQANPKLIDPFLKKGVELVVCEINKNPVFVQDVDGALKSNLLDTAITSSFYQKGSPKSGTVAAKKKPASSMSKVKKKP
jgi:hypothetical protein